MRGIKMKKLKLLPLVFLLIILGACSSTKTPDETNLSTEEVATSFEWPICAPEDIKQIAGKMLDIVKERLSAMNVSLETDNAALDFVAEKGYDPIYGARPLRRCIQSDIEDVIAERILDGSLTSRARVTAVDGKISISP